MPEPQATVATVATVFSNTTHTRGWGYKNNCRYCRYPAPEGEQRLRIFAETTPQKARIKCTQKGHNNQTTAKDFRRKEQGKRETIRSIMSEKRTTKN